MNLDDPTPSSYFFHIYFCIVFIIRYLFDQVQIICQITMECLLNNLRKYCYIMSVSLNTKSQFQQQIYLLTGKSGGSEVGLVVGALSQSSGDLRIVLCISTFFGSLRQFVVAGNLLMMKNICWSCSV